MKNIFLGKRPSLFAPYKKVKNTSNTKKYTKNTSNTSKYNPFFRALAARTYQPTLTHASHAKLETWSEFLAASKHA